MVSVFDTVFCCSQQGFCVKCKKKKYNRPDCGDSCKVFKSKLAFVADKEQKTAFIKECFTEAFTSEGIMKDDYQCSDDDMMYARASIASF